MRRHWMVRHANFDQIESNLTTILGGKEFLQSHTHSPYFHEIGKTTAARVHRNGNFERLDFQCVLRLDNRQPVRFDQFNNMRDIGGDKKLEIPEGCER